MNSLGLGRAPEREALGCIVERASSKCRGGRKWSASSVETSNSCQHGVALTPCWQRAVRQGNRLASNNEPAWPMG